jgi:hypothetical protein
LIAAIDQPTLITHVFFDAGEVATADSPARRALDSAWAAMKFPGRLRRWGPDLPEEFDSYVDTFKILAASSENGGPGAVFEAYVFAHNDIIGISSLRQPGLAGSWPETVDPHPDPAGGTVTPGVLGRCAVYCAVVSAAILADVPGTPAAEAAATAARDELVAGRDLRWREAWAVVGDRVLVWEAEAPTVTVTRRVLAMLGPDENAITELLWSGSAAGLPPMTAYLLNAAKMRYEYDKLSVGVHRINSQIDEADRRIQRLSSFLDSGGHGSAVEARHNLAKLMTNQRFLLRALADVRGMDRSVNVARDNMVLASPAPSAGSGVHFMAVDLGHVDWMLGQLQAERTYLGAAYNTTTEVSRQAEAAIERIAKQRSEYLSLLQASLLGAIGLILASVQAFNYTVPLARVLQAPLMCTLGAIAGALPSAVLRWSPSARDERLSIVDGLLGALFGGSLFWLVTQWWTLRHHRHVLSHSATWWWSGIGAVIAVGALGAIEVWKRNALSRAKARDVGDAPARQVGDPALSAGPPTPRTAEPIPSEGGDSEGADRATQGAGSTTSGDDRG